MSRRKLQQQQQQHSSKSKKPQKSNHIHRSNNERPSLLSGNQDETSVDSTTTNNTSLVHGPLSLGSVTVETERTEHNESVREDEEDSPLNGKSVVHVEQDGQSKSVRPERTERTLDEVARNCSVAATPDIECHQPEVDTGFVFVAPLVVAARKPQAQDPHQAGISKVDRNNNGSIETASESSDSESDGDESGITIESRSHMDGFDDDEHEKKKLQSRTVESVYAEDTDARIEANAKSVLQQQQQQQQQPSTSSRALQPEASVGVATQLATDCVTSRDAEAQKTKCFLYSNVVTNGVPATSSAVVPDQSAVSQNSYSIPQGEETIVLKNGLTNVLIRSNVSSSIILPNDFAHEGTLVITNVFEGVHHRVTTPDNSVIDGGAIRWFVLRGGTTITLLYMKSETESSWWRLSEVYRAQSMQLFAPPVANSNTAPPTSLPQNKVQEPYARPQQPQQQTTVSNNNVLTKLEEKKLLPASVNHSNHSSVSTSAGVPADKFARPVLTPSTYSNQQTPPSTTRGWSSPNVVTAHPPPQTYSQQQQPQQHEQPAPRTVTRTYYKPSRTFFGLPNPFKPPIRVTTTIPIEDLSEIQEED